MKVLVVLCAVVACGLAKPSYPYLGLGPVAYSAPSSYSYSTSVVTVNKPAVAYAAAPAPAPVAYAAPAVVAAPAPAPVAYAAPAVVAAPAPAPVAYAAPAVVAAPAPAPVAYAAPAVVAAPAPAPVAYAAPAVVAAPAPAPVAYAAHAPAVVAAPAVKSQYHAQNEIGEASYGHAEPGQTHNAVQDAHGNKIGSFSYVNPEGHVLRTDYVADGAGYRVASNALPTAPVSVPAVVPLDTPEVAEAKAKFFSEYAVKAAETHARRRRSVALLQTPASTAPLALSYPAYAHPIAPAVAYAHPIAPAVAYTAPIAPAVAYTAPIAPAVAYTAPIAPAVAYTAPVAHAPAVRPATLTTVVNNPGHGVSYRVD